MFNEIISPLFTTVWGRRIGWGALICSIFLFIITFYQSLMLFQSELHISTISKKDFLSIPKMDETKKQIAAIPDYHLFGKYSLLESNAPLPITSLQLHLIGVIKALPESFSRVIISEGDQPGKINRVGDSLTSGVKINAILPDGVVLENGGHLEKLPLQRTPLEFKALTKPLHDANKEG